jgi:nitrogen fixation protein
MLSVTIIDKERDVYEAIVVQNDVDKWRGRVKQYDDWQKQLLELVQQAYRTPKGNKR